MVRAFSSIACITRVAARLSLANASGVAEESGSIELQFSQPSKFAISGRAGRDGGSLSLNSPICNDDERSTDVNGCMSRSRKLPRTGERRDRLNPLRLFPRQGVRKGIGPDKVNRRFQSDANRPGPSQYKDVNHAFSDDGGRSRDDGQ